MAGSDSIPITRIFLDTNILHQTWPTLSVTVENMFKDAAKLGVALELPSAAFQELEANWKERIEKELDKARSSLKVIGSIVENPQLGNNLPDWDTIRTAHASAVQSILSKWSIAITPFTGATTSTLFTQAVEERLVFGAKGVNFQDAVILHSCIDRLVGTPDVGGIVSEDGIFHSRKSDWQAYARDCKVDLRPFKLSEIVDHFLQRLSEADRQRITAHRALASTAITAYIPTFQSVFNDHLKDNPLSDLRDFKAAKIISVDVTQVPPDTPTGTKVRVSAIVRGMIREEEHHYPTPYRGTHTITSATKPLEVGFTADATYHGDHYTIDGVYSMTFGEPGSFGTVGHSDVNAVGRSEATAS